jgi:hypothetical protein
MAQQSPQTVVTLLLRALAQLTPQAFLTVTLLPTLLLEIDTQFLWELAPRAQLALVLVEE